MKNEKYPVEKGWIQATLELINGHEMDERGVKIVLSLGQVDKYEFGEIKINGNKATAFFRQKPANTGVPAGSPSEK